MLYTIRKIKYGDITWISSKIVNSLYLQLTKSTLLEDNKFEEWFNNIQLNPNIFIWSHRKL